MPDWEPPYLALHRSGELAERARLAAELLRGRCRVCPRLCKVERLKDEAGLCLA
jgi:putative pyruvate formate lyase activating enzyme